MIADSSKKIKIIHTADLHLGVSPRALKGKNIEQVRRRDFREAFKQVIDGAIRENADILIIAGDVFHKTNPSPDDFIFFGEQIGRVTIRGTKVIVIAGNHDKPKRAEREHQLSTLVKVHAPNFYFTQNIPREPLIVEPNGKDAKIAIIPIPYIDPRAVEAVDSKINYELLIKNQIEKLLENEKVGEADYKILVAHTLISGSKIKDIATVYIDERERVSLEAIKYSDFDYIALGHIHENQRIRDNVWYSGSVERIDFTEYDEDKFFNIVYLEGGQIEVKREKLNIRPMQSLSYRELKDSVSPEKEIDSFLESVGLPRNSILKLVVRGEERAIKVLNETIFRLESLLEEKYGVVGYKLELRGAGIIEDILSVTEEIKANIRELILEYIDKLALEAKLKEKTKNWAVKIIEEVSTI